MDFPGNEDIGLADDRFGASQSRASAFDSGNMRMSTYGMSPQELGDLRLDLAIMDQQYAKWAEEDQSMASILGNKQTKQRNLDFRQKLESWKKRVVERKAKGKSTVDQGLLLRNFFDDQLKQYNQDRDRVEKCIQDYNNFAEDMKLRRKENKVINDFLANLPDGNHSLQLDDLDKLLKNEQSKAQGKQRLLEEFVQTVKQECVMNQNFFSFFEIPEVIVKKSYSRKDYDEVILKFLMKV